MNPSQGYVTIRLGDGEKRLRFTTDALCSFEDVMGKPATWYLGAGEELIVERVGVRVVRALIWAGLRGAGSKWKLEAVGRQMELAQMPAYMEAIAKAFAEAYGAGDEESPEEEADPTRAPESGAG
jgi:hypothetical protein